MTPVQPKADVNQETSIWPWAAIVAAGIAAAWLIPFTRPGINIPFVAALVLGAAAMASRGPKTGTRMALFASSFLLLVPFAVLDAGWVLAMNLLLALALIAIAAVDGSQIWHMVQLPLRFLKSVPLMGGLLIRPLTETLRPKVAGARLINVVKTALLAGTLLLIFGSLFASADSNFARLLPDLLPEFDPQRAFLRVFLFTVVVLGIASVSLAGEAEETELGKPWFGPTEWKVTLVLLDALFAVFVALQLKVLFGGHALVQQTQGLTYAEHARSGFFQLIAAAALTFLVLAGAGRHHRQTLVSALSGVLCLLTLVVLASALSRLRLYEGVFGYTPSRMFAHWVILWLGALMVTVIALAIAGRERVIVRAGLAVTVVALLIFSLVNPDRKIAELNVKRYEATGRFDTSYCYQISADSVPELLKLPAELRPHLRLWAQKRLAESDPLPGWNLSRENARQILKATEGEPQDAAAPALAPLPTEENCLLGSPAPENSGI